MIAYSIPASVHFFQNLGKSFRFVACELRIALRITPLSTIPKAHMAGQFDEFDVGDNTTLIASLLSEIESDGYDCASVDVLVRMAR